MVSSRRVFEASRRWLSMILERGYPGRCCRCDTKFRLGDEVVTRDKQGLVSRRHYHKECWEAMFI